MSSGLLMRMHLACPTNFRNWVNTEAHFRLYSASLQKCALLLPAGLEEALMEVLSGSESCGLLEWVHLVPPSTQ